MKKPIGSAGLTLIEIIIAMGILGAIMIAYLAMFGNGFATIVRMGNMTEAMAQAQKIIDTKDYTGLVSYGSPSAMLTTPYDEAVDMNGRYCTTSGVFTPGLGALSTGSYDTVTVMIFYQKGTEFITLTALAP